MNTEEINKTIDEHKEWQDNQYNPGHWLGGNIPPFSLRKNRIFGYLLLFVGILPLLVLIISTDIQQITTQAPVIIISLVLMLAGWSKIK